MQKSTEDLSKRIKEVRANQNLGVKKFCKKLSISEGIFRNIEKHKTSFNEDMYKVCAIILNIDIEELKKEYPKKSNIFFEQQNVDQETLFFSSIYI